MNLFCCRIIIVSVYIRVIVYFRWLFFFSFTFFCIFLSITFWSSIILFNFLLHFFLFFFFWLRNTLNVSFLFLCCIFSNFDRCGIARISFFSLFSLFFLPVAFYFNFTLLLIILRHIPWCMDVPVIHFHELRNPLFYKLSFWIIFSTITYSIPCKHVGSCAHRVSSKIISILIPIEVNKLVSKPLCS